jgi:hypothetical protein
MVVVVVIMMMTSTIMMILMNVDVYSEALFAVRFWLRDLF